jgi:hypothetical protein
MQQGLLADIRSLQEALEVRGYVGGLWVELISGLLTNTLLVDTEPRLLRLDTSGAVGHLHQQ